VNLEFEGRRIPDDSSKRVRVEVGPRGGRLLALLQHELSSEAKIAGFRVSLI
jgi:hypothetical protein